MINIKPVDFRANLLEISSPLIFILCRVKSKRFEFLSFKGFRNRFFCPLGWERRSGSDRWAAIVYGIYEAIAFTEDDLRTWRIVENIYSLKFSRDDTRSCVHMRANRYELKRKGEMEFCGEKKFEKNDEGLKKEGDKEWDKYSWGRVREINSF